MSEGKNSNFLKPGTPRVFAHRGSAGTHPENTLESFHAGVAAGAHYLELDVHMTRDGEVVVSHDEHLERTCGRSGLIANMTMAELATADAGRMFTLDGATFPFRDRGIKVPRLADVIAAFPNMLIEIEVKQTSPSVVPAMLAVIDRFAMRPNVFVASEHQEPLDEIRKLAPDILTGFSYLESGKFFQAMAARESNYRPPGDSIQISHFYENWELVTRGSVEFAHSVGIEMHVWTVNEVAEMRQLLDIGVDGLISDFPARALEVIRTRASASL